MILTGLMVGFISAGDLKNVLCSVPCGLCTPWLVFVGLMAMLAVLTQTPKGAGPLFRGEL